MNNNKTFKFTFIDIAEYTKDNQKRYIIVLYCNFGFIVNLFVDDKSAKDIKAFALNNDNDVSLLVNVVYNKAEDKFAYYYKK